MSVTRTLHWKMIYGIAALVVLLVILFGSSLKGLEGYGQTVKDLGLSIRQSPRSAELVSAISSLVHPLTLRSPLETEHVGLETARVQQREFLAQLAEARRHVDEYERKLMQMPTASRRTIQQELAYQALFTRIEHHFGNLEAEAESLTRMQTYDLHKQAIINSIGELIDTVQTIPDPSLELTDRLVRAEGEYRWHMNWVVASGFISLVLFAGLVVQGYRGLFRPLARLHEGALRVANRGDFDYRIESTTGDELSELAEAFNSMTSRFKAVAADLDAQVQQRSRQLVESERLAGVGFLAAGVAHEINNPLSAITSAADSLEWRLQEHLDKFPEADAGVIREYLEMMQKESQRCRQITEKLLNFARGQDSERNQYDVTAIVQEVISMVSHLGQFRGRKIELSDPTPRYAWINGDEVKQVVLNLVANALQATDESGRVHISMSEGPEWLEIAVTDDGAGMTPDVIAHIFEPFFTRRKTGQGTGLGLSISHRIVQDHGGSLEACSDGPGCGSTFRLRLPVKAGLGRERSTAAAA